MCSVLPMAAQDYYLVIMYRSMLTLAFRGLLHPGEFTYYPHVVRIENVFFDNGAVIIFLLTSKVHNKNFEQRIRITPPEGSLPVILSHWLLESQTFHPGTTVCKARQHSDTIQCCANPVPRFGTVLGSTDWELRIGATTELDIKGFTNQVIQSRADGCHKLSRDISVLTSSDFVTEAEAVWLIGDKHLANVIPKFLRNRLRYPELAIFPTRKPYGFMQSSFWVIMMVHVMVCGDL